MQTTRIRENVYCLYLHASLLIVKIHVVRSILLLVRDHDAVCYLPSAWRIWSLSFRNSESLPMARLLSFNGKFLEQGINVKLPFIYNFALQAR